MKPAMLFSLSRNFYFENDDFVESISFIVHFKDKQLKKKKMTRNEILFLQNRTLKKKNPVKENRDMWQISLVRGYGINTHREAARFVGGGGVEHTQYIL